MSTKGPPPRVVLYMKPGCHLCEQAEADLARLRARQPHTLLLVDITSDAELMERYGLRIPVLAAAGYEYDAPLDATLVGHALAEASRAAAAATSQQSPSTAEPSSAPHPQASTTPVSAVKARRHGN
jgi:hypothetical protein